MLYMYQHSAVHVSYNILQFFWTITCTSKSNKFAVVTSSKEWFNSDYKLSKEVSLTQSFQTQTFKDEGKPKKPSLKANKLSKF